MRIAILAVGSQGDVQPLAALGSGLRRLGHEVTLVSHAFFESTAERCGLSFAPVPGDPREIVQGEEGQAWVSSGGSSLLFLRRFARIARRLADEVTDHAIDAVRGCDGLVYGLPLAPVGYTVAEVLGIPGIPTSLYPVHPSGALTPVLAARLPLRGALFNRLGAGVVVRSYCTMVRGIHGAWRRRNGLSRYPNLLPAFRKSGVPYLYGYSPEVVPTPCDWDGRQVVCGYWFPPPLESWRPTQELLDFLGEGDPPLYVGFGSMPTADAASLTRMIIEAIRGAGRRALLATGWGGLDRDGLPPGFMALSGFVPHEWLFPRVAAAIHHGGAGTTAMALRVGVPSIIVPFFADQFFWATIVERLGVAPRAIFHRHLSSERLEAAIREVCELDSYAERARVVGERVRAENGVEIGASAIDGYLRKTVRRTSA